MAPVKFDDSGFRRLQKKLRELPEVQEVPFPCEFMERYTDYVSIESMLSASGFSSDQVRGFQTTRNEQWEEFIRAHTRFESWGEFMETLSIEHLRKLFPEFK